MADNTQIQQPTVVGDTISTEDIAGVKIPRSKLVLGASGVDGGNVSSANPIPTNNVRGSKVFSTAAPTASAAQCLAANASRKTAVIYNNGSQTVYLGGSGSVTTSNGLPLLVGASVEDDTSVDAWFAVTASGTGDLRIVEVA